MRLAVLPAALLAATLAQATDLTVAGMKFGAPVVTKPCASKVSTKEPCLLTDQVTQLGPDQWVAWMMLPRDQVPQVMVPRSFKIYSKGGALVGVEFWTYGLRTQAFDIEDLTKKYGPPTTRQAVQLQNRMGANVEAIIAGWAFDDLSVAYFSWFAGEEGRVQILTPAGLEIAKAEEARQPKQPKL